jgi:hypothetical protein
MKTAFLHVGLPKTGSTSIQDFLHEEGQALEAAGFLFPSPISETRQARIAAGEGWGRHASLLAAIQGDWDKLAPGEWDAWQAEFARFRGSSSLHTLIISHETIGNRAAQFDLGLLCAQLQGYRLRVLLVVREAEAWLTSLYEQRISGRRRMSGPADSFGSVREYLRGGFQARIEALQQAFPQAEIIVMPFETLVADPGLVPNSAAVIGLPTELQARAAEAKRVNTSLSQDRIEILRRCNGSELPMPVFVATRRALAAAQRRSTKAKLPRRRIFSPETAAAIGARYAADRTWLARAYGLDLPIQRTPALEPFVLTEQMLAEIVDEVRPFLEPAMFEQFVAGVREVPARARAAGRERLRTQRRAQPTPG